MVNTNKYIDKKPISYEVSEDGYDIYLDGKLWITQHGQYGKPMSQEMSYEQNCLAHIDELVTPAEQQRVDAILDLVSEYSEV